MSGGRAADAAGRLAGILLTCFFATKVQAQPDAGAGDAGKAESGSDARAVASVIFRGQVVARGIRESLAGASITVDGIAALESGVDGRFELPLSQGRHQLQIQFPGYEPAELTVTAGALGDLQHLFLLSPRQTGERYESVVVPPAADATRVTLRQEELTKTPGTMGEPFRVIESLPGVAQPVWPLALYTIRGANPGNTGFFVDGVRLPALFHLALGPSVIHPFFIEQLDFYPGGYPARYGRFVSGIVAAKTQTPKADRVHGAVDVRLFDAGGIIVTPVHDGRGNVAIAGRYSFTGLIASALSPTYTLGYWDYQARGEHSLGPGRLVLFLFGSSDTLGHKKEPDTHAQITFHRADLRWEGRIGGGRFEAGALVGWDRTATLLKPIINSAIRSAMRTIAPRVRYVRPLGASVDVEAGADSEFQHFSPQSTRFGADTIDVFQERNAFQSGAYLAATLRPGDRWVIAPALRHEIYVQQGTTRNAPSPRLSVRRRFGDALWVKAMGGAFTQMASYPVAVPGFEGFGLKTIGLQSSYQGSAGVEAPLPGGLSLELSGFYQRFRLTDLRSQFEPDPNQPILELRDGQGYGLEFMIRRPLSQRLHGWLAYTLSRSERLTPQSNSRFPSDWDQRHILNLVLSYRLPRGFTVGGKFHLNTGRPFPLYDMRVQGPSEYVRLPTFYRVDLRADRRFIFDRFALDVYFEFINATFKREVFDVRRGEDGALDEVSFPIVLPTLGVHAEW